MITLRFVKVFAEIVCSSCTNKLVLGDVLSHTLRTAEWMKIFDSVAQITCQKANAQNREGLNIKVRELNGLIALVLPMVLNSSFLLGILYRELSITHERLGEMDKCVDANKHLIAIAEYVCFPNINFKI